MGKVLEALREKDYNNGNLKKKKIKIVEKSRDFYDYFPGTKRVIAYVSEEERNEVYQAHQSEE